MQISNTCAMENRKNLLKNHSLVEITENDCDLRLVPIYENHINLSGKKVYDKYGFFLRDDAASALKEVSLAAQDKVYTLEVYEALRPISVDTEIYSAEIKEEIALDFSPEGYECQDHLERGLIEYPYSRGLGITAGFLEMRTHKHFAHWPIGMGRVRRKLA